MGEKKKKREKGAPKAAPRQVTKDAAALAGPRPLSRFDFHFCHAFVQTGKQVDAYREAERADTSRNVPTAKDPHRAAARMMQRPEIREHIKAIYTEISRSRAEAAKISARAALLTLEVADDRVMELLQQRRRTRGEMLTRDAKMLLVDGAVPMTDDEGNFDGMAASPGLIKQLSEEPAPIEDADLLKAAKLAYDRLGGVIKREKPVETVISVSLYRPKWLEHRQVKTIEAATA